MKGGSIKLFHWADLALYSILLILSLQVYGAMAFEGGGESVVVVERNGEILGRYSLQKDQHVKLEAFTPAIYITIENSGVSISEVDCPAQICKRIGRIIQQGQSIACVPNKLLIYIERKAGEPGPPKIIIG